MSQTSSHALLNVLAANGVDRVFLVPGESYLGILDALVDFPQIDTVTCRHEGGAGYMAVADGRLAGRPGVALVSRGPGMSNAAIAVHTAQQDAVPLIMIVGQVAKKDLRREAFQEIDYQKMFGSIAKWVFEPTEPGQLAEAAFKAVRLATTGTPGPVVLVIPEDIQQQETEQPEWQARGHAATLPDARTMDDLAHALQRAQRPLVIAGGTLEQGEGRAALLALAQAWALPVAVSFRRHDVFPNTHPQYVGELGLANPAAQIAAFEEADFILALGTRLGDIPTQGYAFPALPQPRQVLAHCYPDPHIVGLNHAADYGLVCSPEALAQALALRAGPAAPERQAWIARLRALHEARAAWPQRTPQDGVDFAAVVHSVARQAPADLAVCLDAGTFAAPVYRHFPFVYPQRLMSPIAGAMGYGVPSAIATALRGQRAVCMVGDGGLLMTGNEMILAVERRLPILFIVSNNGSYASIRIHQERHYPGRVSGTALNNPDFLALARAYGMPAQRITEAAQIDEAIARGLAAPGPVFIEVASSLGSVLP
ncbi:thiamine pyrophosphate-binding protein [Bordetella genomosp. 12]|nr:thiamine pyrophosphate-binding protein [Bordetella genomosp. 12]